MKKQINDPSLAGAGPTAIPPPSAATASAIPGQTRRSYEPKAFHYVPQSFKVPPELEHIAHKVYYIIDAIRQQRARNRYKAYAPCNSEIWDRMLGRTDPYLIKKVLKETGDIQVDERYKPGVRSKGYRLNPKYDNERLRKIPVTNPLLLSKILLHRITYNSKPVKAKELPPVYGHLHANIQKVEIDAPSAYNKLESVYKDEQKNKDVKLASAGAVVSELFAKHHEFSVDERGRLYTLVTRMKSELRSCLLINKKQLKGVDIVNSQMIFLCQLFIEKTLSNQISNPKAKEPKNQEIEKKEKKESNQIYHHLSSVSPKSPISLGSSLGSSLRDRFPQNALAFIEEVMQGTIYDTLQGYYNDLVPKGQQVHDRGDFKRLFFMMVVYGDQHASYTGRTPLPIIFETLYPSIYSFILSQKMINYEQLSLDMQRAEANFMMHRVCHRLMTYHPEIPVVTVHDSILTTPEHLDKVEKIIKEEFARLNLYPQLRRI
jgi:hypothetical protein